ncbi:MAG: tyrosine--tRNA ligase [Lentisphaerae bacterium]|nr:tyrosine--tRNA ligase [Lentisphaerota bacterium]
MANVLDTLKDRLLFDDMTSPELATALDKPITVYAGFDPSCDSLQAGNFVTIMALSHFQRAGHRVIVLVGGATGLIGDPSGKSTERNLQSEEDVLHNLEGIKENLSRFIDFEGGDNPAIMVNNYDWHKEFSFITFLRDVGGYFRVNQMMGKESVRKRLESQDGMSFTEFCYQILQGYDFLHLYREYGCTLQIGGSDQWGNITAGTELVRRVEGASVYGLTFPLVCDSQGRKFGKSEGNAMYLDQRRTSYYAFYQFFLRTLDSDVIRFLRIFTFLTTDELKQLEESVATAPEKREAQRILAEHMTRTVHGEHGLSVAERASKVLFGGSFEGLMADDLLTIFADVPSAQLSAADVLEKPVVDVAALSGLCNSKGEARRLLQQGGLSINNERVTDPLAVFSAAHLIEGRLAVLRAGKKNSYLLKVE